MIRAIKLFIILILFYKFCESARLVNDRFTFNIEGGFHESGDTIIGKKNINYIPDEDST